MAQCQAGSSCESSAGNCKSWHGFSLFRELHPTAAPPRARGLGVGWWQHHSANMDAAGTSPPTIGSLIGDEAAPVDDRGVAPPEPSPGSVHTADADSEPERRPPPRRGLSSSDAELPRRTPP